jgi:acyl-CoA oxidase
MAAPRLARERSWGDQDAVLALEKERGGKNGNKQNVVKISRTEALTRVIADNGEMSGEATKKRRSIHAAVAQDPFLQELFGDGKMHRGTLESLPRGPSRVAAAIGILESMEGLRKSLDIDVLDRDGRWSIRGGLPASVTLPTDLHDGVCLSFVASQFDADQQAQFLPPMLCYDWVVAYAQTELSHGSNVAGLTTTATFVKDADAFDIHSPDVGSIKWWPGDLGHLATHVLCTARLVVGGEERGIFPFLVPVRDPRSHEPLPGVEVGDIGPTGYDLVDNGFARFRHVRVPRTNMAMRHARVTASGEFERPAHARLTFGGMLAVRTMLVSGAASVLAAAVTIAVRYSAQRLQFGAPGATEETAVLDYTMQQHRLLPLLATVYAARFVGRRMRAMADDLAERIDNGDLSTLPEVHATSSGLKSLLTGLSGDGIEVARKCCGGHGYSHAAGFWSIYQNYVGVQTAEGENYLLTQQTARFLLKAIEQVRSGPATDARFASTAAYLLRYRELVDDPSGVAARFSSAAVVAEDLDAQLFALERRSAGLVAATADSFKLLSRAHGPHEARNLCQVEFSRISRAHCLVVCVQSFIEGVRAAEELLDEETCAALRDLCALFALYHIEDQLADFTGWISGNVVREAVRVLLGRVRRRAVPLVDAFDLNDFQLRSAIGRREGQPYETLLAWAQADGSNSPSSIDSVRRRIDEFRARSKL